MASPSASAVDSAFRTLPLSPYELAVGLRYTRARRGSGRNRFISFIALTSMAGIALGVMALIVVLSVMNGFQEELRNRILAVASHIEIRGIPAIADDAAVAKAAMANPHVKAAAPYVLGQAMLTTFRVGTRMFAGSAVQCASRGGPPRPRQPFGRITVSLLIRSVAAGVATIAMLAVPMLAAGATPKKGGSYEGLLYANSGLAVSKIAEALAARNVTFPGGQIEAQGKSLAIDPSGELVSGETFKGPADLRNILLQKKREDFMRCLSEKMLTYALGRGLEFYDRCAVDQIGKDLVKGNYRFSALINAVAKSTPFQMRRGEQDKSIAAK